jgi:Bifunctional DNA primase/polymerase, N-terminal/Primase C terminal 2 (PriCT-2)
LHRLIAPALPGAFSYSITSSAIANNTSPTASNSQKPDLRTAVRAAIEAYKQSGKMLNAALAYAAHGFPVFPLTSRKTPVPERDKDANGKKIPGTGSFKKATCDPTQIRAWWKGNEYLIGLPMGAASGVWCLDIDTSEDHADGVAEWNKIVKQHTRISHPRDKYTGRHYQIKIRPPFVTREHRSATGGPHLIFNWYAEKLNGCSNGALPDGISVKAEGGYIVVPPSRRKRRSYTVHRDIDPIDQPQWLTDLILQGRTRSSETYTGQVTGDLDEISDALSFIPNNDASWEEWTAMGLRIFAATNGEGFVLFDAWSQKSSKYDPDTTLERWEEIQGCPPTRTGVEKIFSMAREHGWEQKLRTLPPVDNVKPEATLDDAREQLRRSVIDFLSWVAVTPEEQQTTWWRFYCFGREATGSDPLVHAINGPTGIGKTRITINELAQWKRATGAGPIVYAVPHHKLSPEIVKQFTAHGLNARLFYGRDFPDPARHDPNKSKDEQDRMCLNPGAVKLAMLARADIAKTCCKDGKQQCLYFGTCGYTRQQKDPEQVEVWITASDMLFHAQKVFKQAAVVIVDEGFWKKGLRDDSCSVPLLSLEQKEPVIFNTRNYWRNKLGSILVQVEDDGPIARKYFERLKYFESLSPEDCTDAIKTEWNEMPDFPLKPGGKKPRGIGKIIDERRLARNIITIWEAVRDLLDRGSNATSALRADMPEIETSGRLLLQQMNGLREIHWRGIAPIKLRLPTLLLDATLPDASILKAYYPQVKVLDTISVPMPTSVRIKQVLDAPTSSIKVDNEKHLQALRRYVLQRWFETGCGKTLVVCQLKVEHWLKRIGLPENVHVEHYNAVTGMDIYRDVRLQILIGRTAPGPDAIENMVGALTGRQPDPCHAAKGFHWYYRRERRIQLRDGSGRPTITDMHPDAEAEAVRWLIHEGELIQAIGRGRGLNRTPDCPLDIDLLVDAALLPVDEVVRWKTPSLLIKTAADEGVTLNSPTDMVRFWPKLWPNDKAADRCLRQGVPKLPGFTEVSYRPKGARIKPRTGYFDLARIPKPQAWIAERMRSTQGQNP